MGEAPRGSEFSFASAEDIIEKFKKLAVKALPSEQIDRLVAAVMNMEDLDDASDIVRLMHP